MSYVFTASFTKEGRFTVARALELGVVSQGKTLEEAKENLQEAVELFLEDHPVLKKGQKKEAPFFAMMEVRG